MMQVVNRQTCMNGHCLVESLYKSAVVGAEIHMDKDVTAIAMCCQGH